MIMALETLTENRSKHQVALELIEKWRETVENQKRSYPSGSEEYEALDALERELLFRREASLRSQIRTLVHDTLSLNGNPHAMQWASRAVKVYDSRSRLVHEGKLPRNELLTAEREAKEIVVAVLKAKLTLTTVQ
jgi:hypothetical protein